MNGPTAVAADATSTGALLYDPLREIGQAHSPTALTSPEEDHRQPIGAPFAILLSTFVNTASVVWNPVTNEFAVSGGTPAGPVLTRVNSTGNILGTTLIDVSGSNCCTDVDTNSGHYVVLYGAPDAFDCCEFATIGAELDESGRVVRRMAAESP